MIENLDIPEKQVMIEARIIETTRNFSRTLGVDWGFDGIADSPGTATPPASSSPTTSTPVAASSS